MAIKPHPYEVEAAAILEKKHQSAADVEITARCFRAIVQRGIVPVRISNNFKSE